MSTRDHNGLASLAFAGYLAFALGSVTYMAHLVATVRSYPCRHGSWVRPTGAESAPPRGL